MRFEAVKHALLVLITPVVIRYGTLNPEVLLTIWEVFSQRL